MYSLGRQDRVVELRELPQAAPDVPEPVLLSDEHTVVLAYTTEPLPSGSGESVVDIVDPDSQRAPIALVRFDGCRSYCFGSPNDEALSGHPLYPRGLRYYAAQEVKHSSWIRELERRNRVHPRHDASVFRRLRHIVITFHDSTFECVAEGFTVDFHWGEREALLPVMQQALRALPA